MALGFTSHYKQGEQATFGSLTHSVSSSDVESAGTSANSSSIIMGESLSFNNITYDSCDFSSPVVIDYTQYATIADGSSSAETAGSIAYGGGDFSGSISTASFSGGGVPSFSGGGCGSGGVSCASFTC